ncbi:MAG: bifunctional histidinol-phosphatase/imidazoleglycerol-phosphate dehydratase HisB [Bacteroidales bacterium]|nr:bifunctional histidinol-phosphatase/imidazoleglycerol-phosphate dehydratase HisB [Bacteroidales bacterium]
MAERYLFIDRDGTLVEEPADEQVDTFEKIRYLPGVFTHLGEIVRRLDYKLVMVTNQDGLGTPANPEKRFWPVHTRILETLAGEGIIFEEVLIDRSFAHEGLDTRKPATGLLQSYLNGKADLGHSYVIGDRESDMELARNLGCRGIRIWQKAEGKRRNEEEERLKEKNGRGKIKGIRVVEKWEEVADYLVRSEMNAEVHRKSRETDIRVRVVLWGNGQSQIDTGIGFFDHMLDQLARHSGADIEIIVKGDLHVDEHHTVEDTAIVLGQALREAWGDLKGLQRFGFVLPMDDARAQVSIDLGGRPYLKWDAVFKREKIGELPTELLPHFFRSFADASRSTIHISATGKNEHHKAEAVFKALARALRQAWSGSVSENEIPTTKGMID